MLYGDENEIKKEIENIYTYILYIYREREIERMREIERERVRERKREERHCTPKEIKIFKS